LKKGAVSHAYIHEKKVIGGEENERHFGIEVELGEEEEIIGLSNSCTTSREDFHRRKGASKEQEKKVRKRAAWHEPPRSMERGENHFGLPKGDRSPKRGLGSGTDLNTATPGRGGKGLRTSLGLGESSTMNGGDEEVNWVS